MEIRPLGTESFYADRRTDGYDEANSLFFPHNFANVSKNKIIRKNECLHLLSAPEAVTFSFPVKQVFFFGPRQRTAVFKM